MVSQIFKVFSIEEKSHTLSGLPDEHLQGQKGVHRIKVWGAGNRTYSLYGWTGSYARENFFVSTVHCVNTVYLY